MAVLPYKEHKGTKKEQVAEMFDNISPKYDFLNRALSLGIDVLWRKKAVKLLAPFNPKVILDVATGTADLAIEATKLNPTKVVGVDISAGMLREGKKKVDGLNLSKVIELQQADSANLPFEDATFDAYTVAFGVRNFENLEAGLKDMLRVLKPGGKAVVLEFSEPKRFPFKQIYNTYFNYILPKIGNKISGDASAYTYLPESVHAFPDGEDFVNILIKVGYRPIKRTQLMQGIATLYFAEKK